MNRNVQALGLEDLLLEQKEIQLLSIYANKY